MADPVLKFPPEQKGKSEKPRTKLAAEPRRRLMAQLEQIKENVRNAIQSTNGEQARKEQRYG